MSATMANFEIREVRRFTAGVTSRLDACDNSEGTECATLDASLRRYADECNAFYRNARQWGRSVFSGRLPLDPEVERTWYEEGDRLFHRAYSMWSQGNASEIPCFELEGQRALQASLWLLYQLLNQWVSPKLSVGPSARIRISAERMKEIEEKVSHLPPLPENWEPADKKQRARFRKTRSM